MFPAVRNVKFKKVCFSILHSSEVGHMDFLKRKSYYMKYFLSLICMMHTKDRKLRT